MSERCDLLASMSTNQTKLNVVVSASVVWGRVITTLRTENELSLYLSCSSVSDIKIDENTFVAQTFDESVFGFLDEPLAKQKISKLISHFGLNYKICLVPRPNNLEEEDIKKLRNYAGEYLKIEQ